MPENGSATWDALLARYRRYRALPFWGTKTFRPDERGVLAPELRSAMHEQGHAAAARVENAITRLANDPAFTRDPRAVTQDLLDQVAREHRLPKRLRDCLFVALVLDRAEYRCRYCRRTAEAVWEESGQRWTIWLEIDHRVPRALGGRDGRLDNSAVACQRCNLAKGSLPEGPFMDELRSIARSVLATAGPPAPGEPAGSPVRRA